jgi:hypothetical protein
VREIKKEILSPTPLNTSGKANGFVLLASKVIIETNLQRKNNGNLSAMQENSKLNEAAKAKATDMLKSQYFEHVSPGGVGSGELVISHGYDYIVTGENLILGNFKDEKEVVQLWMNSPGHRANILNNRFTEIGVAIVKGTYKGQTVWIGVQEFGLPLSVCSQANESLNAKIKAHHEELQVQIRQIEAKRQEINNTNQNSEQYNQLVDEYNAMVAQYNSLNEVTKKLITTYNSQVNAFNICLRGS